MFCIPQNGTAEEDRFSALFEDEDGSVILAGYTRGVWDSDSSGGVDFAAVKLDKSGVELWRWQVIHTVRTRHVR